MMTSFQIFGSDLSLIKFLVRKDCSYLLQRIALAYLVVSLVEIMTRSSVPKALSPGKFSIFKLYILHW